MSKKSAVVSAVIVIVALAILGVFVHGSSEKPSAPRLVAHAGGEAYGIRLTNSLQALDNSYSKGFRYFELDIDKTSDGVPVFVHDWGNANWFMNVKYSTKSATYQEFKSRKTVLGLKLMDLDTLEQWLGKHKDAYIITDVKGDNIEQLTQFRKKYPEIYSSVIPQIYSFEEYDRVKALGYENIILTLYRLKKAENEILDFCGKNTLFAVTVYQDSATAALLGKFVKLNLPVYVHTVNDYNQYVKLRDIGAYGVYTDYFEPDRWVD